MSETQRPLGLVSRPPSTRLLWGAFIVPPAAWVAQLMALYMLEDFISCNPGSQTKGVIMGAGVRPLALGITFVLGLLTAGAGLVSVSGYRRMRNGPTAGAGAGLVSVSGYRRMRNVPTAGDNLPPAKWLALAGAMNAILFFVIIALKAVPPLILGVCQSSV
ncbi:MAG: hypothetical protein ACRDIU_10120 [Actinomycetota bacterium]